MSDEEEEEIEEERCEEGARGVAGERMDEEESDEEESEMEEVLAEASSATADFLGVQLALSIVERERSVRRPSTVENLSGIPAPSERYLVIAATSFSRTVNLAEVKLGDTGYPISLRWDEHYVVAGDRAGFEDAVRELLPSRATATRRSASCSGMASILERSSE